MDLQPGEEPIADDEIIYRRIPVSTGWYSDSGLSSEAFDPRNDEDTGISVYRAKYKSLADAAKGKSKKGYFVAVFKAGELRSRGIEIVPRPLPNDPGHSELPQLTCNTREDSQTIEIKDQLAALPISVEGPFIEGPIDPS